MEQKKLVNVDRENVIRTYKDTVFRMLFNDKQELLQLYNAMNHTNYKDPELLEIVTLENAIYMNVKNDLAFLMDFHLYLYEHQSSVNPNMPLRFLQYVAREYEMLTREESIYGEKLIQIPAPHFVVFYYGRDEQSEHQEYLLSKAYLKNDGMPQLELKVQVININIGNNTELMNQCQSLKEYMQYVNSVREKTEIMGIDLAVNKAVDECIKKNILKDFLLKNKTEVVAMSIFEYNEEETIKAIGDTKYASGVAAGKAEGKAEGIAIEREQGIKMLIQACQEFGASREVTLKKVIEKYELEQTDAEQYLKKFWK